MDRAVNADPNALSTEFINVANLGTRHEEMFRVGHRVRRDIPVPMTEVLCDTTGAEIFFRNLFNHPNCLKIDMAMLQNNLARNIHPRASFNVFAANVFTTEFEELLQQNHITVKGKTFELLEYGGVPRNFCPNVIAYLINEHGINFALDDIRPLNPECQERLRIMGEHVQMIKLDYSVADAIRKIDSKQDKSHVIGLIKAAVKIRQDFPNVVLVAEGVRNHEWDIYGDSEYQSPVQSFLHYIGVDAVQIYTPPISPKKLEYGM